MSLEDDEFLSTLKSWFQKSSTHFHEWRKEAKECYAFVAGDQWSDDDKAQLKLQNRPNITFNRTSSVVDSVAGLEITNRQEVRFIPRQVGKSGVNELLTSAAKWVRDECNAEDEESDAFVDLIISGIGCTETRVDYDVDPEGKGVIVRIDPMEMFVDAASRQRNFIDAKHVFRVKEVSLEDAEEMFPDAEDGDLNATWANDANSEASKPHDATEAKFYQNDQAPNIDKRSKKIKLVEAQWWELEKNHRVVDPVTKKAHVLNSKDYKTLTQRADQLREQGADIPELTASEVKVRKYYRAIIGNKILKKWDGPESGGFTYKFMTGKRDRNKGVWFGLVRAMLDPQRWANKWLSQVLHIINTNAKGGLMAEKDAFENPEQAQETWADPAAITMLAPGAIEKKKIQPKPMAQYPQGIEHLMTFAISSIRDVAGVNLELLGMANKDQPGILEHQRKQAGMTILANFFDSLRHYRKEQGKLLLWYIINFLSDGRLVRIGGPDNAQYVSLVHEQGLVEYDVIVDEMPTSPNQKERTWDTLVQMLPFLAKMPIPPQVTFKLLQMSPLPASLVAEIEKISMEAAKQAQQQPNPEMLRAQTEAQAAQAKMQTDMAKAKIDIQSTQMKAQADQQKAQANIEKGRLDTQLAIKEAENDQKLDVAKMILDSMLQAAQAEHGMKLAETNQQFGQQQSQKDQQFNQQQSAADQDFQHAHAEKQAKTKGKE